MKLKKYLSLKRVLPNLVPSRFRLGLSLRSKYKRRFFLSGFSVFEVILAVALFVIFAAGAVVLGITALRSNRLSAEETVAAHFASEGIESVRSIKKQNFANLTRTGSTGVVVTGGTWSLSGVSNTLYHNSSDNYVRTIAISDVYRDAGGNIVTSGGTLDTNTVKVVSTVSWKPASGYNKTIDLTDYFSNWEVIATPTPTPVPTSTPTPTPPAPTNTPSPTATITPTPLPTNTPVPPTLTPTPTPVNCSAYCTQKYSTTGACAKTCVAPKRNEGKIYECTGSNVCCCN